MPWWAAAGLLTTLFAGPAASARVRAGEQPVVASGTRVALQSRPATAPHPGRASVVVTTHNDGDNLPALLARLLAEPDVGEVIVVASGCIDGTVDAVTAAGHDDARVQLYVEQQRSGKMAALNCGFAAASRPVVVVVSGDVLPAPAAIARLVRALDDPRVGMAGGRPVPVNDAATFMGHAAHLLWRLHHRLALRSAKVGEMAALRAEVLRQLPPTAVDEAWLQAEVARAGWVVGYVPQAVVSNRGPSTARDFVRQRRRVHGGHLWLRSRSRWTVPSLRPRWLIAALLQETLAEVRTGHMRALTYTAGAVALEAWARLLARIDHLRGREAHVWAMVHSAKGPALDSDRRGTGAGQPLA